MLNIYRERLLKLADLLDHLPPEKFDFRCWFSDNWDASNPYACGTTACALGWATTIPELGLMYYANDWGDAGVCLREDFAQAARSLTTIGHWSLKAGYAVFGLSAEEFLHLFTSESSSSLPEDASPTELAQHIRSFVEKKSNA